MTMRIAVVGCGILGASAAHALARFGCSVEIYDKGEPGSGTTRTTFAWLNSHRKQLIEYHLLNVAGMAEHRGLAGPDAPWLRATGNLEWATDAAGQAQLEDTVQRLRDRDYAARWISAGEASAIAPGLRVPPQVEHFAWFPDEAHVHVNLLLSELLDRAREHGAALRCPSEVTNLQEQAGGVIITTAAGDHQRYDAVVLAAGRWSEPLAAVAGLTVPMSEVTSTAVPGLLGYTSAPSPQLGPVLTSPRLNVRSDTGGRLVLQALDLDVHADPRTPPTLDSPTAKELTQRLRELLDGHSATSLEEIRVGLRSLPADGLTVAGRSRAGTVYVLATHSGVTLGPLLGRLAAEELLLDQESSLLAGFRPQRFEGLDPAHVTQLPPARRPGEQ